MTTQSQEKKYYTPSIEEFHVGFEFEMKYIRDGWQKETFGVGEKAYTSIPQLQHALMNHKWNDVIRVKYLDEEDILAEGWNELRQSIVTHICTPVEDNPHKADLFEIIAAHHHFYPEHFYKIRMRQNQHQWFTIFNGTIRNRSELRQIMRMTGIK